MQVRDQRPTRYGKTILGIAQDVVPGFKNFVMVGHSRLRVDEELLYHRHADEQGELEIILCADSNAVILQVLVLDEERICTSRQSGCKWALPLATSSRVDHTVFQSIRLSDDLPQIPQSDVSRDCNGADI